MTELGTTNDVSRRDSGVFVGVPVDLESVTHLGADDENKLTREELLELKKKYERIERVAKIVIGVATVVFVSLLIAISNTNRASANNLPSVAEVFTEQIVSTIRVPEVVDEANLVLHAVPLSSSNFTSFLLHNEYTFVNFFYARESNSQRTLQQWHDFAETMSASRKSAKVVTVNCGQETVICQQQDIRSYPTLRFFEGTQPWKPDYHGSLTVSSLVSYSMQMTKGNLSDQF